MLSLWVPGRPLPVQGSSLFYFRTFILNFILELFTHGYNGWT